MMTEMDDIQSRIRENGPTAGDRAIKMAIRKDLDSRSEAEAEFDRCYWHTVARRDLNPELFGVDD